MNVYVLLIVINNYIHVKKITQLQFYVDCHFTQSRSIKSYKQNCAITANINDNFNKTLYEPVYI